MEENCKNKDGKYLIPKGKYYRRLPRNITTHIHNMENFGVFVKAIGTYTHLLNYTYGEYRTNDFYIGVLHQIRMMLDVICKCTAFYLTDSKDTFLKRFIDDRCVNNQKKKGKQLTNKVVIDYLESRYTGIKELYEECNHYLHPTIFYYKRYEDSDSWFISIRNLHEQKKVFDFFFEVSNLILIEILTDAFNSYAVSKYGLEPITITKVKRPKLIRAYTKEALESYKPQKEKPSTK